MTILKGNTPSKISLKIQSRILYVMLGLAFVGPALFAIPVGSFHLFPFRLIYLLMLPLFLIDVFWRRSSSRFSAGTRQRVYFLLFWLIYAFISAMWATSIGDAITNLVHLSTGILVMLMMTYYFTSMQQLQKVLNLWIGVFVVLTGIGLWEIATGNHLPTSTLYAWTNPYPEVARYVQIQYLPSAVFTNPNDFGTFILLAIAVLLGWSSQRARPGKRVLSALLIAVGLFVLVKTESRANLLGVVLVFGAWGGVIHKRYGKLKILVLLTVALLCVILLLANPDALFDTALVDAVTSEMGALLTPDENIRFVLYGKAIEGLLASYGLGLGAGNVETYIGQFTYFTSDITNVHNWWLEIAANYGLLVLVGYLILYFSLMRRSFRILQRTVDQPQAMLVEIVFLGLLGLAVGSFSSSSLIQFLPYWMFLGLALAVMNALSLAHGKSVHAYSHYPL